ncbi:glycosyltransferase [Microbacterium jiangjiandongii]|uniref:glycosyltransferase n=1 Tax=Microbacterium jiangjiandongii TaxID=3049071 RepID=UPI00214C7F2D|nr:glycosyltransferase [Microbacterium sp. zg.Y843]MCR2816163.1 glycosyltransferase [Microbacterium sp. zg.Y843]
MAQGPPHPMTGLAEPAWRTLQRCVLSDDPRRAALYARGGSALSRDRMRVAARASFATYFGAFPAGYWAAHTAVGRVRLAWRIDGTADVVVRGTDAEGVVSTLAHVRDATGEGSYELDITPRDGWLWCDIVAAADGATIGDVRWEAPGPAPAPATLTVCVTTFDREADCVRLLDRFAEDPGLRSCVDRIVVADQGTRPLVAADGFASVAARLGTMLQVVRQPNVGGSGGFSRGMVEAAAGTATHALLLDDDVDLEPESVRRLAAFAESSRTPTIVGAQMLSLVDPTRLHSFGERIERSGFWWEPVEPSLSGADLSTTTVESTPELSHRIDVDFNGWWMCLIPTATIRRLGASLPLFIKWDDAEYGLRAAAHGVTTVTLPGAALWHMPWTAKDDGLDWQAYFQLRNRLVAALLHGRRRGGRVLSASFAQDVNHLLCGQYGSAAVRALALTDLLRGPAHLWPVLRHGPARPAAVLTREGQAVLPESELPRALVDSTVAPPRGAAQMLARGARVLFHQLRPARSSASPVRLTRAEGKWWALGMLDSAIVDAASGKGAFAMRRSRGTAARGLRRAVALRARLWWQWPALARAYREAAPQEAAIGTWQARLATSSDGPS